MPRRPKSGSRESQTQRQLRVGELVRHALADILIRGEVHDDEIAAMTITVPEVRMSPDLKLATCYVVALVAPEPQRAAEAMERHRRYLRGAVAKRVNLRFAPDLRFRYDKRFEAGARIDALLRSPRVSQDLHPRHDEDD